MPANLPIINCQQRSNAAFVLLTLCGLIVSGCASQHPFGSRASELDYVVFDQAAARVELTHEQRMARLTGDAPFQSAAVDKRKAVSVASKEAVSATPQDIKSTNGTTGTDGTYPTDSFFSSYSSANSIGTPQTNAPHSSDANAIVRGQSPDSNNQWSYPQASQAGGTSNGVGYVERANQTNDGSTVRPAAAQYPALGGQGSVSPNFNLPSPLIGSTNEVNPAAQNFAGNAPFPENYADLDVYVQETQTGKINFGGAYNSDNGVVGQFIIDERNFDLLRFPRSFRDVWDGTAWRGAGQTFRLELVPGANLQRYLVSFSEPYFLNTDYSFSASGYLFERQYFDWDEHRLGGRFALGRRLDQDISINAGLRLESVKIDNPRLGTSAELNNALGTSNLFLGNVGLVRDTRDNAFLATKGTYFSATVSQAFGDYSYTRGDLDYRRYRLMYERPDGSGRHTISYGTKLGFSGSDTPIFENYFAGGFSTMRGFDFRGAAPVEGGVRVGGDFQWLNTLEYMFPLTADDMIKGVMFCDFGTVEQDIDINKENFRVAPGFGFRIHMPAAGIGAPLAFDFAFPISTADGDDEKMFSFYLGVLR